MDRRVRSCSCPKMSRPCLWIYVQFLPKTASSDGLFSCLTADVCRLPFEAGKCHLKKGTRFFFNSSSQRCESFQYGGCFGNENNFMSEYMCSKRCECSCQSSKFLLLFVFLVKQYMFSQTRQSSVHSDLYFTNVGVDCQQPDKPENGQLHLTSGKTTYESEATFSCNVGHYLRGTKAARCEANRQWSSMSPLCIRKCNILLVLTARRTLFFPLGQPVCMTTSSWM